MIRKYHNGIGQSFVMHSFVYLIILICMAGICQAQENLFSRNFTLFPGLVQGVDFFATSQNQVKAFEKPIADARQRLQQFLGDDLAPGAVFICSSVITLTPDVGVQQSIQRMKSRMEDGQIPPEMLNRIRQRASGLESRMVETTALHLGYAILTTTLNPDKEFRTSRLEDMNRSPLAVGDQ